MANLLIYGGLIIFLIGSAYGLFVAIKAFRQSGGNGLLCPDFSAPGSRLTPQMRKLTKIWAVIMVVGLMTVTIGMII